MKTLLLQIILGYFGNNFKMRQAKACLIFHPGPSIHFLAPNWAKLARNDPIGLGFNIFKQNSYSVSQNVWKMAPFSFQGHLEHSWHFWT